MADQTSRTPITLSAHTTTISTQSIWRRTEFRVKARDSRDRGRPAKAPARGAL